MTETSAGTLVPYAEFVARRNRRLRIMAELRSQARDRTIEGEVVLAQALAQSAPGEDQEATSLGSRHASDASSGSVITNSQPCPTPLGVPAEPRKQ